MVARAAGVVLTGVTFGWPDGRTVLDGASCAFPFGVTGLVGDNGSGKTTLLRLIEGAVHPRSGAVEVAGPVGYLPQNITMQGEQRIEDLLGIARVRAALAAVEAGAVDPDVFDTVGDAWDVEESAQRVMTQVGVNANLDRSVAELSGGQTVLLRLAGVLLTHPRVLLLDEPTNNLDRRARAHVFDAIASFNGAVVVVSHDRELLEHVDQIVELRHGQTRAFGGPLSFYERSVAAEQEAAAQTVRTAKAALDRQRRHAADAQTRHARSARYGKRQYATNRIDKPTAQTQKRAAQSARGKERDVHRAQLARFLFTGSAADQLVRTLSGGERLRATLAALLLAQPAPQLLLLDEPTNNLDLRGITQLGQALNAYQGALIIVSHDGPFLRSLNLTAWATLTPSGLTLRPAEPPG